ncbi:hypothetical protein FQK07_12130 [Synechococcus sp. BSF8S]|uniref:P-type ATPase n=1 Tax=Synechococcales TaxID=1890424 RepID=UPI0016290FFA|nr:MULTISPECIES: cation-transporting P-type ATPase [unclassified Synechococcus]MBC1261998.1 hypothetical protein [Synechococcus sp. BSF8S]MBC1264925.1 hypothetical protein [Synechococcus sp. BSA11S]
MAGVPTTLAEAQDQLRTGLHGLSGEEARQRLQRHGPNTLPEAKRGAWSQLLEHLWGPIPWMIEAAALLAALVRDWADFGIITTLPALNALVGFWVEHQPGHAIEALRSQLAPLARVKRDGQWNTIPARELVPGDLILLRSGDIVPADALVQASQGISHFQQAVLKIGDYLIAMALVLVLVILMVGIFRHQSLITILQFSLVLTVASIPVAMPAVLCSDKTDTLTRNQLSAGPPFCFGSCTAAQIMEAAALASRWESQDSIDLVVLNSADPPGRASNRCA